MFNSESSMWANISLVMFREGSSACLLSNRVEGVSSDSKDYLRDLEKVDEQNKI